MPSNDSFPGRCNGIGSFSIRGEHFADGFARNSLQDELKLGEFAANLPTEQIARIIHAPSRALVAINRASLQLEPTRRRVHAEGRALVR